MSFLHVSLCGLIAVAGCASRHSAAVEPALADDVLALEVENHNWADVVIYVVHDGTQSRFMDLSGAKSAIRPIPARFVGTDGTIRLLVHRIGSADNSLMTVRRSGVPDDYLTEPVSTRTGRTVALTLESDLQRSSLGVW